MSEEVRKEEEGRGLRYNSGKLRYDLLEPYAIEQLVKVFTKGSMKYAAHNWLKGMSWSSVAASLKRHLAEFEKGEDFDEETGLHHMAHVAWNALALVSYYKYFPQGDDRLHTFVTKPRIGLDIDDVLAKWITEWAKLHKMEVPTSWYFDRAIKEKFTSMTSTGELNEFYSNLPVLTSPMDIPFEPVVYVTSRPVPSEITEAWLDKHGFPAAPVETVGVGNSKVDALKRHNVDIFVDDNYQNFMEINKAGICCYLFTQEHNKRYNVGHRRINALNELSWV